ncbi:MAG TPA: P-loop NTPase fold protein [bacterium]|nr:P-loop NTPase fold protein [bacterium]HPN45585.1 P-loop NTPase fold protein [bacterium]
MFNADQPILTSKDDILGRKNFAYNLADTITSYKDKNNIVIGLYGEWGSGKTSLLNLITERINLKTKNSKHKPIIIKFNPWNFSEQNQLITQFFYILSLSLKRKDNSTKIKNIGEKIEDYSQIIEPLSLIPVVGQYSTLAKIFTKLTGSSIKKWGKSKEKTIDDIRDELNKLLCTINRKIIVIIDDIDRLTPIEIRQIFQLVKKLGDFPNTIYILSFDKNVVLKAFEDTFKGFEKEYLEKIIQIPIEIPQISKAEIYKLFFNKLEQIIVDIPEDIFDSNHMSNIFHDGLKYFFNNLRDVNRFTNTLSFNFSLIKGKVNPVDFIAITALQIFLPNIYYHIRDNKELYIESDQSRDNNQLLNEHPNLKEFNDIISTVNNFPHDKLIDFLTRLFPSLGVVFNRINYNYDSFNEKRKKGRICCTEMFDIYFTLTIHKNQITLIEMKSILSKANSYKLFSDSLILITEKEKILYFLDSLGDYTKDKNYIPDENISTIINVLMNLGDTFPEQDFDLFTHSTSMDIFRIIHQLCLRFKDHENRYNLIKNAIEQVKDSIYTIVYAVNILEKQQDKNNPNKDLNSIDEMIVTSEQFELLKLLSLEKIEKWAADGRLLKHRNFVTILFYWKDWAGIDVINQYVKNLIKDKYSLILFITSFLNKSKSYGMSDYTGKENLSINLKSFEEFIDIKLIEPQIRKIYNSKKFEGLSEVQIKAINLFIDTLDGKINYEW